MKIILKVEQPFVILSNDIKMISVLQVEKLVIFANNKIAVNYALGTISDQFGNPTGLYFSD